MSYGISAALQSAVYQHLLADPALNALIGDAVYDALPQGTLPQTYVSLGPEQARAVSDTGGRGAWHRFTVSVVTDDAGFHAAKTVAAAISDALTDAPLALSRGRLVALSFFRARARREGTGDVRRIDITFRARVDDAD